jgi:hypothetical protein
MLCKAVPNLVGLDGKSQFRLPQSLFRAQLATWCVTVTDPLGRRCFKAADFGDHRQKTII